MAVVEPSFSIAVNAASLDTWYTYPETPIQVSVDADRSKSTVPVLKRYPLVGELSLASVGHCLSIMIESRSVQVEPPLYVNCARTVLV